MDGASLKEKMIEFGWDRVRAAAELGTDLETLDAWLRDVLPVPDRIHSILLRRSVE